MEGSIGALSTRTETYQYQEHVQVLSAGWWICSLTHAFAQVCPQLALSSIPTRWQLGIVKLFLLALATFILKEEDLSAQN